MLFASRFVSLFPLSLVLAFGCTAGDNLQPKSEEERVIPMPLLPAAQTVKGPDVNGLFGKESAAVFYQNLTYVNPGAEGSTPEAQRVLKPIDSPIKLNEAGDKFVEIEIYLLANQTFLATYRETDDTKEKKDKDLVFEVAMPIQGEWVVQNTKLDLIDFGVAETGSITTTRYDQTFRTINLTFQGNRTETVLDGKKVELIALPAQLTPEDAQAAVEKDAKKTVAEAKAEAGE
jgi:hypothetical protein